MADWLRWWGVGVVAKHSDDHEGAFSGVKFWGSSIHPFLMSYATSMKMVGRSSLQWPSQHHWAVFDDAAGGDNDTFVQVTQMAGWDLLAGWSLFLACLSLFLVDLESCWMVGVSLAGWSVFSICCWICCLKLAGFVSGWLGPLKGPYKAH